MNSAVSTNPWENEGRERKSQAIARAVWRQLPPELRTNLQLPPIYARATPAERAGWAQVAGVKNPSDLTWTRACEILAEKVLEERRWLSIDREVAS